MKKRKKKENFIPLKNAMAFPLEFIAENELLSIYKNTGENLVWYRLNKCKYCFPIR